MSDIAAQHRVSRQISRRFVFEFLLRMGPISRADLSKETGLSKQTISEIIETFEQQGWVRQTGRTSGNVGRTAVLYEIAPHAGYVIGVDLGGTKVTAAIADISCEILAEITEPTDPKGGQAVLDQVVTLAAKLAKREKTNLLQVRATVIGTPGVVSPTTGSIELAPNIAGLEQIDARDYLRKKFGGLLKIEYDVNLALLGEIWQGCARDISNVAFVALGTGLGLGLSANGQLIRGETGAAGELGFLPLGHEPFAPSALSQGSLEYDVGAAGIMRRYREAGGKGAQSARDIFDRSQAGDETAVKIVDETAKLMGFALASVGSLFDPKITIQRPHSLIKA